MTLPNGGNVTLAELRVVVELLHVLCNLIFSNSNSEITSADSVQLIIYLRQPNLSQFFQVSRLRQMEAKMTKRRH